MLGSMCCCALAVFNILIKDTTTEVANTENNIPSSDPSTFIKACVRVNMNILYNSQQKNIDNLLFENKLILVKWHRVFCDTVHHYYLSNKSLLMSFHIKYR
jgi:hypothetical protein